MALSDMNWLSKHPLSISTEVYRPVLIVLVGIDLFLIAVHCIAGVTLERIPPLWNIALDFSLAEILSYFKWAICAALLFLAWRRSGIATLGAVALIFAVITLDDSLQIHENFGALYAGGAERSTNRQDIGELIAFGLIGGLLSGPLIWSLWRSGMTGLNAIAGILCLIALLAVFGIGVDALHMVLPRFPGSVQLLDLVEDGGEMIVGSILVAHVWALRRSGMQ